MTPERWRQVEEIFQNAVELDGAERDAFLTEACGGDALSNHRQALALAEGPAADDPRNVQAQRDLSRSTQFMAKLQLSPDNIETRRDQAVCYVGLAHSLRQLGQSQEALTKLRKALEMQQAIAALDPPPRTTYQREMRFTYGEIGALLRNLPRARQVVARREACDWRQRSLQIWDEWLAQGLATRYAAGRRNEAARVLEPCEAAISRPAADQKP